MPRFFFFLIATFFLMPLLNAGETPPPNILIILADDLGYGDVKALNPDGKIATPHIDKLAAQGMIFTDAHSSSAVCTPSRYSLMTGRYNWRSRLKGGVQGGHSPHLIEDGRLTIASMLKSQGYSTACIGKWHLGMDWPLKPGAHKFNDNIEKGADGWNVDFTLPILNGPTSVGFDQYFGISASLDMVPYTYIENDRVKVIPTVDKDFPMTLGKPASTRKGPADAAFDAMDVLPTLTKKAVEYIEDRAQQTKTGTPFFLYLPLNAPHTPIVPSKEWQGKSGISPYADFVMEVDWAIGQVLEALDKNSMAENTLVVVTSDNGCSPEANFKQLLANGHNPSYVYRGHKADIFDGGHRVPFIVRWPGHAKPGSKSDQLVCLMDCMATCAEIIKFKMPDTAAEDSVSFVSILEGKAEKPVREALVHHSINGSFAIRQGNWKLELCSSSGGWSDPKPASEAAKTLPKVQLYDLTADIGEKNNLYSQHPEIVDSLTKLLQKYVDEGRSTPGTRQANTGEVKIWRDEQKGGKGGDEH